MFGRLLFLTLLIVVSLFCLLLILNPVDVEFHFLGKTIPTELSTLMISSFLLGGILALIIVFTRDAKRAIEDFRESRQKKKIDSLKEELDRGMDRFLRGDLEKAKTHFVEVLKRDPAQIDLYLRLSEIYLREENDEEALHWLTKARLIDMKNVDILFHEARLYQRIKRFDEAIRSLNRIIDLDESNLKALRCLREIFLESRRWEDALRIQKSILKATKGKETEEEEEVLFFLGLKYELAREFLSRGSKEDLEMALKEAKEIARERKTFLPGFVLLGDVYLRMGRWASAGKVWGKSLSRFKSVIFILRLEELYFSREDPSTLLRIYQKTLSRDPENWVIAFFYAKLCLRLELLDEALEALDAISLKQEDFSALHRLLAEIYLHKQDFGRAAHEFEKTFELSGTSYLPFYCTACERESKEWVAYCPQCHRWSTYTIKEGEKIATPFPPSISERVSFALGR